MLFLADRTAAHSIMNGCWHNTVIRLSVCLWHCALWHSGSV